MKQCYTCRLFIIAFLLLFLEMKESAAGTLVVEQKMIQSALLKRAVIIDVYLPLAIQHPGDMNLLLFNDGQDLLKMPFDALLTDLMDKDAIEPLLCVGIHCSEDRKQEYGMAKFPDYLGRGSKAGLYTRFILEELIPFIKQTYRIPFFRSQSFAGFSLGGLMALDIVWNHPDIFTKAGVFSGSLWWRRKSYDDGYSDEADRLMHNQIRDTNSSLSLQFFFQTGTKDETGDRNGNGIIDSIDDTLDLIGRLKQKGYHDDACFYYEIKDGTHDVHTWAKALPAFLKWGWKKS
jgi:enterochelin esterase-like enzyme